MKLLLSFAAGLVIGHIGVEEVVTSATEFVVNNIVNPIKNKFGKTDVPPTE